MFMPCKESILEMTPTEFEKHSLRILTEQIQNIRNCNFQHNKIMEVDDGNYQIDGYIEFELMGIYYKTLIECKHYKSSISREKVAVLYDKIRACGANKGVLVSSSNFQSGAVQYASKHGVALIQLTDADSIYETRSDFTEKSGAFATQKKKTSSYIGVMQVGDEHIVNCLYLSNTELNVRDFLIKRS
ncbi:restriction endonuclease [Desulfoscipio sp. XC116]|uniref:restriction endonuclease n=1 Tax=Desulfoscipio sp. XC116 TaxID=3144975 RepID=UPI00325B944C